jgi:uncharacterized protein involved in oxidation of intracellular sulfur
MTEHPDMLITLTNGKQDRGTRATLAFAWGCSALAMGQNVTIYLTMDGTVWAARGAMKGVKLGGFDPLEEYLEQFISLGGRILVCAPCTEYYCSVNGHETNGVSDSLIENAQVTGLATIVSLIGGNTKTITL